MERKLPEHAVGAEQDPEEEEMLPTFGKNCWTDMAEGFAAEDFHPAADENRLQTENRIRNLVWTVSGDYTMNVRPDVERFEREKYCVLYDCIRQGAFAKWFDQEAYQLYLVKKIYCHAMEAPLKMTASLVTEAAVGRRLLEERKGVAAIRRMACEELLDHEFSMLCASAPGQLQLAWIRRLMDPDYRAGGNTGKWLKLLVTAEAAEDTGALIRLTDTLYNQMMEPDFERKKGTLEQILAVTVEELKEFSWQDFLSEEMYEDALETYLEKLSLDMNSLPEAPEQGEDQDTEGEEKRPKKKKIVVVDEDALSKMHSYVELNYGKTWLSPAQEKQRNRKLCRGMHGDCSLYYTEGILKHPVKKNYQLVYAQKQKDKNLHAYYDAHREVKQNIRQLTGMLRKALILREEVQYTPADSGKIVPSWLWKAGRCPHGMLFLREQKNDAMDFVVDVLIDASGSQRTRQAQVAMQGFILSETLSNLGIPFRVMSFCTFWDYTILHRFRDYDDDRKNNGNLFEYMTSSNNRDGLAIRAAGTDLMAREEARKLMIVLSDGKPYDVLMNRPGSRNPEPYRGEYAVKDTAREVLRLRQQGVSVLGVFAGEERELPAERKIFGKDFAYIRDIRNFAGTVGRYLLRQIDG